MQVLDPALTRYEALGLLPEQLHPFIIFHDFDEPMGTFDRLKKASEAFQGDAGPGTSLSHPKIGHVCVRAPGMMRTAQPPYATDRQQSGAHGWKDAFKHRLAASGMPCLPARGGIRHNADQLQASCIQLER